MRAAILAGLLAASVAAAQGRKLTADECVAIALADSGNVAEAKGKVSEWAGRLAEVESTFYPKLIGLGYVAPMYRLRGDAISPDVQRNYWDWGPYLHLQAILAQPIYTFGRVAAGKEAAGERLAVERARLAQTRNTVALEVRKYYYLHLFAKSMKPALESAKRILDEAESSAKTMYDEGSGKVTNVDLMQLRFGSTELQKYLIQAEIGADLALAALKHTMALPQDAVLEVADESMPGVPEVPLSPLAGYIRRAAEKRPEVAQLFHGEIAAKAFERSERLSSMPVVFVAGQLDANWTPMWPDIQNPFAWDRYNDVSPGIAVGLQFDVDIAKTLAKAETARGTIEQVEGLRKFASTGIPMEVRKAFDDAVQAEKMARLSEEGSIAGRKWMIFAGSAYVAGTGEAKHLLEGMAAYLQGKKGYYESLQALHVARATLVYSTGGTGLEDKK
ncbi:MAG: TolC family protein [Myxococcaceae bacterium]